MYKKSFHLLCILLNLCPFILAGQEDQSYESSVFSFDHLGISDGLSALEVNSILQDSTGFIWIATRNGLNRYDGSNFKVYASVLDDSTTINTPIITDFIEHGNHLWLSSMDNGVNLFNKRTAKVDQIINVHAPGFTSKECHVNVLFKDSKSRILAGTEENGLFLFDPDESQFKQIFPYMQDSMAQKSILSINEDQQGRLWLGTGNGAVSFNLDDGTYQTFNIKNSSTSQVMDILFTPDAKMWLATSIGLCYFDKEADEIRQVEDITIPDNIALAGLLIDDAQWLWMSANDHLYALHLPTKKIYHSKQKGVNRDFIQDNAGSLWLASDQGVHLLHPQKQALLNQPASSIPKSIRSLDQVRAMLDTKTAFWFRNDNSVYRYDYKTQSAQLILNTKTRSIKEDKAGNIWIASSLNHGIFCLDQNGKVLKHFLTQLPSEISYNENITYPTRLIGGQVLDIEQDYRGNWWFGIYGGLNFYDVEKDTMHFFYNIKGDETSLYDNRILSVGSDVDHNLWVGCYYHGLHRLDLKAWYSTKEAVFEHYQNVPDDTSSLSNNSILDIVEDQKGDVWFCTNYGINKYIPEQNAFKRYNKGTAFKDKRIMAGVVNQEGELWFSTEDNGLLSYERATDQFLQYGLADGLQHTSFLHPSAAVGKDGNIMFGSNTGIAFFNYVSNSFIPPVQITNIRLFDEELGLEPLHSPVKLKHHQNEITVQFAALNYISSDKNQYQYQLEPLYNNWRNLQGKNTVTLSNLPPDQYTFSVKGSNNDGMWNETPAIFSFTIHPPWWRTYWAYLLYTFTLLSAFYLVYRFLLNRQLEKNEAARLQELDVLKNQLYTNISHEFRTPLTVILGMADQTLQHFESHERKRFERAIHLLKRNGNQLLHLVNQMLELAKLDAGKPDMRLMQSDIIRYTTYVVESFSSYAESKSITIFQKHEEPSVLMDFDSDKWQSILSNLLSNAIKYTPEGGAVFIRTTLQKNQLMVYVKDNGVGIEAGSLPHIFDRFYLAHDDFNPSASTGIGLALTQQMVLLHGGQIEVESEENKGTIFIISLPIHQTAPLESAQLLPSQNSTNFTSTLDPWSEMSDNELKPLILIIEDNPDVAYYISECLSNQYQTKFATNGKIGIEKAIEFIPDFIISDVMMPIRNGYEVCADLKQHELTDHIPILLLTAKADQDSRKEGLKVGADAYLTKPFDKEELLIRVEQLIQLRRTLQERFQTGLISGDKQLEESSALPHPFMVKLQHIVEENLSLPDLGVQLLCKKTGASRSQLHRKIKSLCGKSTTQFVRSVRIEKAKQLLQNSKLNISEIAYDTGFNSPAYFTRVFTRDVGQAPTDFRVKHRDGLSLS